MYKRLTIPKELWERLEKLRQDDIFPSISAVIASLVSEKYFKRYPAYVQVKRDIMKPENKMTNEEYITEHIRSFIIPADAVFPTEYLRQKLWVERNKDYMLLYGDYDWKQNTNFTEDMFILLESVWWDTYKKFIPVSQAKTVSKKDIQTHHDILQKINSGEEVRAKYTLDYFKASIYGHELPRLPEQL